MSLNSNNLTFVIVTYKSEGVIIDCIKSLPKDSNIIIIENSNNPKLKQDLEEKFLNLTVFLEKNIGMGSANNKGIKICKTDFVFVINPDVRFESDAIKKLIEFSKHKNDYAILAPISNQIEYPNYIIKNKSIVNDKLDYLDVDTVDGFAMLINKKKFKDNLYFDENFFLYLENDDLCLRKKNEGEKVYVLKTAMINHLGGKSSSSIYKNEIEYSRHWHWMWSKFYFNKKHYGFLSALRKIFFNLISAKVKFLYYLIIFNQHKKKIYKMRLLGLINSIQGKKSWHRPKI
jgi:N-acetylglucosaminyl-diphospho-decaprenol L-rhamnosyltransferase